MGEAVLAVIAMCQIAHGSTSLNERRQALTCVKKSIECIASIEVGLRGRPAQTFKICTKGSNKNG